MSADPPNPFAAPFDDPKPNPYQSPDFTDKPPGYPSGAGGNELNSAILTQQRVVAILMIIQGTLSMLLGLVFIGSAFFVPTLIAADMQRQRPGGPAVDQMVWILLATYGVMGACGVVPGVLQIYAGIQNLWLKGHMLGVVAISSGVLTIGTCYCIPTALALLIYGLIIYLHATTKIAFQLAKEGHNFDTIMQMAVSRRY